VTNNSQARKERQAAALRENLKRRKARIRALAQTGQAAADGAQASRAKNDEAPSAARPNPAAKNT
jgi:hypothetical protein